MVSLLKESKYCFSVSLVFPFVIMPLKICFVSILILKFNVKALKFCSLKQITEMCVPMST